MLFLREKTYTVVVFLLLVLVFLVLDFVLFSHREACIVEAERRFAIDYLIHLVEYLAWNV